MRSTGLRGALSEPFPQTLGSEGRSPDGSVPARAPAQSRLLGSRAPV